MSEARKLLRRRVLWALRTWPVTGILPVLALHLWIRREWLWISTETIDRCASAITQIAGGLLVLKSIDENLGLFRRKELKGIVAQWWREFPRPERFIDISAAVNVGVGGSANLTSVSVQVGPKSLEQQLAELRASLAELTESTRKRFDEVGQRVETVRREVVGSIAKVQGDVTELAAKVDATAVGGLKPQVFGVLLAIYGAIAGIFG